MPPTTTPAKLLSRAGGLAANFRANKDVPALTPNMNLPGGIKGGVAQIRRVWIGAYGPATKHPGAPFFGAQASVVAPAVHNGIPVKGLFTRVQEPLCDTPEKTGERSRKTKSEHFAWVIAMLKLLGFDSSKIVVPANLSEAQADEFVEAALNAGMAALTKAKPYISFETREGQVATSGPYAGKPAMVFEEWGGLVQFNPASVNGTPAVIDSTPVATEAPAEQPFDGDVAPQDAPADADAGTADEWEGIAEACEASDAAALKQLWDAWEALGKTEDDAAEITFAQMVEVIRNPPSDEVIEDVIDEPEPFAPKAKDEVMYTDPKGKPAGKEKKKPSVKCVVTGASKDGKVFNLKAGKTVYAKVKLEDLSPV